MRSNIPELDAGSPLLGNIFLFAVVLTTIHSAGTGLVAPPKRRDGRIDGCQIGIAARAVLLAFGLGLIGLASGIGLTWAIVSAGSVGVVHPLTGITLRIIPIGILFSLVGSVVGDLNHNLVWFVSRTSNGSLKKCLIRLAVAVDCLCIALAWLALNLLGRSTPAP
jgi:hypothetical protein